ncbi:hypothetical protein ACQP3J_27305 [Escherichia coli]
MNCLTAEELATTAKRNAAGLIQFIYFKNALTSKFKYKDMLLWKRDFICVPTGNNKKVWIPPD